MALPPPAAMADTVRLAQSAADDPMQGFRVYPGRNRGDFARLGLHPGDLITAVNGVSVAGQAGESVADLIKQGSASTITVFRAGREQEIQLPPMN
jgi:general secretion pathway protein C